MKDMPIKVKCTVSPSASIPLYQSQGAAGADICACLDKPLCIRPGQRCTVPTGLCFEIPFGYEIQVRARSGLAAKYGITVLNSPGTIDSDYRGELKVILINYGTQDFTIAHGERIAQLILAPVSRAEFCPATMLSDTKRGSGGFGSTGR